MIKKDARGFGVADGGVEVGRISFEMPRVLHENRNIKVKDVTHYA